MPQLSSQSGAECFAGCVAPVGGWRLTAAEERVREVSPGAPADPCGQTCLVKAVAVPTCAGAVAMGTCSQECSN